MVSGKYFYMLFDYLYILLERGFAFFDICFVFFSCLLRCVINHSILPLCQLMKTTGLLFREESTLVHNILTYTYCLGKV